MIVQLLVVALLAVLVDQMPRVVQPVVHVLTL